MPMDPLSVAASVAGLISLCVEVGKYISEVKDAPKNSKNLQIQLSGLEHVLEQLDSFLHGESVKGKSFEKTSVLCQALGTCKEQLIDVSRKSKKSKSNILQRAVFPFREKELGKLIESLRGCTQTFQFSLTIEGCTLLSQTSEDVSTSLGLQLETSRKLFEMTKHISTMSTFATEAIRTADQIQDILILLSSFPDTAGQIQGIIRGVERLEINLQDSRERAVFEWLSTSRSIEKHHDMSARRTPGTGEWLLEHPIFTQWMRSLDNRSLILFGGPGVGKTILTSMIVDHLIEKKPWPKKGAAWYYCDYREQATQTPANLTASLLRQFSSQTQTVPKAVLDFYELYKKESVQPQARELLKVLLNVCSHFGQCFVIIDALDEIDKKHCKEFLRIVQELRKVSAKIFITSRPHLGDITSTFTNDLQMDITADSGDIRNFLSRILEDDDNMQDLLDDPLREDILDTLSQNAGGMFLLPALQIQAIVDQVTKSDIRAALRSLSFDIREVFESSIQRIRNQSGRRQEVAMRALMWISYARRPLAVNELRHALATRLSDSELDRDNLVPVRAIIESCFGLVIVDHESSTIRLVHLSLQVFFEARREVLFPSGDSIIAKTCLTYLSFDNVSAVYREKLPVLDSLVQDLPLLAYSAEFWGTHAKAALTEEVKELTMQFFEYRPHIICAARLQALRDPRYMEPNMPWRYAYGDNALHSVSRFDIFELIPAIIQQGADFNELDCHGNTPLLEATYWGNFETAKILLEHGAEFDDYSDDGNTSLFLACSKGDEELIQLLLRYGANPDQPCKDNWTPFHRAADNGHLGAVKLLLNHGCSKDSRSSRGLTALHRSAGRGHIEIVGLLIERGCCVNAVTHDYWTPLHGAACGGQHETMRLLLDQGATVNHQSLDQRTALHRACRGGHLEAVKVLLEFGADRLLPDELNKIPLHRAAKGGHFAIVQALLDVERAMQSRQLSAVDQFSMTSHDTALGAGHYALAKDLRVVPNMPKRQSEIETAVDHGDEMALRNLLNEPAEFDQPNEDGLTPLHQAVLLDHHDTASLLLGKGANVEAQALNGWSPLHTAARKGSLASVQLCLKHGANVMSRDARQKTPLHKACQGGNVDVVRLLLDKGADPAAEDDFAWRPIHACAAAGHGDVARLLLLERDDLQLDMRDMAGRTPQACAARAGHHDLVEFLRTRRF